MTHILSIVFFFFFFKILNALTFEILEHQGTFRTPSDQIQFITKTLKDRMFVSVSADSVIVTVFIRFKSIFFFFFPPSQSQISRSTC